MSLPIEPDSTISDAAALSEYASIFIAEFKESFSGEQPLSVDYTLHQSPSAFPGASDDQIPSCVYSQKRGARLNIHLYQPALIGIPTLALQGWLDLELASHVLTCRPDALQFNFRRDILPLIDVSGMAVQVMRYLLV